MSPQSCAEVYRSVMVGAGDVSGRREAIRDRHEQPPHYCQTATGHASLSLDCQTDHSRAGKVATPGASLKAVAAGKTP